MFVCCLVFFCVEYKVCEVFDGILVYFFSHGSFKGRSMNGEVIDVHVCHLLLRL